MIFLKECFENVGFEKNQQKASKHAKLPSMQKFNKSFLQSELPQPIPQNSGESDHGCKSRIYFENAGDNVTLMLYNVTLTSQNPCYHNNRT